eukprot:SAG31_NODE_275_length_18666_cov_8.489309_7_plen_46_part_00
MRVQGSEDGADAWAEGERRSDMHAQGSANARRSAGKARCGMICRK